MRKDKGKEEGIVCTDMFGKATLNGIDNSNYDVYDDDSNVSDDSYVFNDNDFDTKMDNKNKLDNKHGIGNNKIQVDYFVNDSDQSESE